MPLRRYSRYPSLVPLLAGLCLAGCGRHACHAFTVSFYFTDASARNSLYMSRVTTAVDDGNSNSGDSNSRKDRATSMARNDARTCVKGFLTQRAIQSFMFLLEECRDPHSGKWIEDFLGLTNLGNYHGTGAFDIDRFPSWQMVLVKMMEMPKGRHCISAPL